MPRQRPVPDLYRTELLKGPFAPSELFTMEAERRWSDGEVLSKRSKVGKSPRRPQESYGRAAARCFAQYRNIPFALFGSLFVVFWFHFFFKESQTVSGNVNLIAYMIRLIKM